MPPNAVTLTVIVPAYNEQENLRPACETILRLAAQCFSNFEIIIVDDSSVDQTWDIAQQLAKEDARIRIFRNANNRGLGFNYHFGASNAKYEFVMLVPGDNEASEESLDRIFREVGKADILVAHIANRHARPLIRQVVSRSFTYLMNFLFHLKLQYYNGINVIRAQLVQKYPPMTDGFAYMALILVQLLRDGHSYSTVGFDVQKRNYGTTKAFRLKNVISVLHAIALLWRKVYLTGSR